MANPNIFAQYMRPARSVADYSADMDEAEGNKLKLVATRMGMEQSQRTAQEAAQRRQAFASSGGDGKAYRNALQALGDYGGVQEFDTQEQARRKGQSELDTADVSRKKAGLEIAEKRINIMGQASKFLMDNPTPENAIQVAQYMAENGVITPEQAQASIARIQSNPAPDSIRSLAEQAFRTALGAKEQLESRIPQNRGGTAAVVGVDPVTGKSRDVQTAPITQSADNAASQATSTSNSIRATGAQMAIAKASQANAKAQIEAAKLTSKGNVDAAKVKDKRETEMKLADDYRAQSKAFGEAASAYKQINATLDSATTSPAATLAAATKFMKILDPGSVVRESELGMALQASGVIDRAMNYMNILQRGKVLTATQAKDFKDISSKMYKAAQQVQRSIDADYQAKAKAYELRPEMITQDLGQNENDPSDPLGMRPTPPRPIFFIIFCIWACCFNSRLSAWMCRPEPDAMRRLRDPRIMSGKRRSCGVMELIIAIMCRVLRSSTCDFICCGICAIPGNLSIKLPMPPRFIICSSWVRKSSRSKPLPLRILRASFSVAS